MNKHKIVILDTKTFNPNRYLAVALTKAMAGLPEVERCELVTYRNVFQVVETVRPDFLLVFGGEEIDDYIILKLRNYIRRLAIWYLEDPYENPINRLTSQLFDVVMSNDEKSAQGYRNGHYLPLAASFDIHGMAINAELRRYHLFFAGSPWPNRVQVISDLLPHFDSKLKIKIFMPRASHAVTESMNKAGVFFSTNVISGYDFARFSARSTATLYLTRDFTTSLTATSKTESPGPRFFETAMAGGIQLYKKGTLDLPKGFQDNDNVFEFDHSDSLMDILNELNASDRWSKAASSAQQAAQAFHSYECRAQTILSIVR